MPPSPPPGICTNECNQQPTANDPQGIIRVGYCNDGGAGDDNALAKLCDFGSDCDDCGVRVFCLNCPPECSALALARPSQGCMESMWDDGKCDPQCNNPECGFNDCSPAQTAVQCVAAQQAEGLDTSTSPANATVGLHLNFAKPRINLNVEMNSMIYTAEISYRLSWADARLPTSPCFAVIDHILTRRVGDSEGQRGYFWVPDPFVENAVGESNAARGTSLVTGSPQAAFNATTTRTQDFEQGFTFFYCECAQRRVAIPEAALR